MDFSILQNLNFPEWSANLAKVIAILIIAFSVNQAGRKFIFKVTKDYLQRTAKIGIKISEQRTKTLVEVFTALFRLTVWAIAILTALPELGINIGPLLAGIGVTGLALGMGAKTLIQDYLTGIFILLEDQYRVGEKVEIGGKQGIVKDLSLRRTLLEESEKGELYCVPNSQIKVVVNLSRFKK